MSSKITSYGSHIRVAILTLAGLLVFNSLVAQLTFRLDLTTDKRYTLHPATKSLLKSLKDPIHVEIYLAGTLPTDFKQLQYNLKALLQELKAVASHPITYQLIDIAKETSSSRKEKIKMLLQKGIEPNNLFQEIEGQRTEKIIYPGAIITYQQKSLGVMLLKSNNMLPTDLMIKQSIENLEYAIMHTIAQLLHAKPIQIGLIQGHQEPKNLHLHGLIKALQGTYKVDKVHLDERALSKSYEALLITKPQTPFSEVEKYYLDQYIMQGGKVLFFLDRLQINMDSLAQGQSFAFPLALNLDDQLFRYGIRINHDLIKDLQAGIYPIIAGKIGNQPQVKFMSWPFFPILNNFGEHVLTKNMNALYAQFISSIDTIQIKEVQQTALLYSSPHSIRSHTPVYVDLELLRKPPDINRYNEGPIPVAYLLEGNFTSLYKNRFLPMEVEKDTFLEKSIPTKIFIIGSGSIVLNALSPQKKPFPWGYDPFLQQHFANQDFVLNVLDYMLADTGAINAKRKAVHLRPLDTTKVIQERLYWQLFSLLTPLVILILGGIGWHGIRKKHNRI